MIVSIYFDGLCEPNPGGVATFGWIVRDVPGADVPPTMGSGVIELPNATNNVAEYVALGKALAFVAKHLGGALSKDDQLLITGDSQLVLNQLKGDWSCRDQRLQALLGRCRALLAEIGIPWSAVWVGREHNCATDALSRAAYVGKTGDPPPVREKVKPKGAKR